MYKHLVKGKAYITSNDTKTWSDANSYCASEYNSNLAVIESSTDNTFARDAVTAAGVSTSNWAWIGFYDSNNDSIWKWIDGTVSSNYTNWQTGQPDGDGDCVHLWPDDDPYYSNWNDVNCASSINFVCDCDLYIGVPISLSWSDAESYCQLNYGSHLASWSNGEELECAYQTAYSLSSDLNFWIGLYEDETNDNWVFSDETSPVYTDWNTGQPDSTSVECAEIEDYGAGHYLNDVGCDTTQYFLCNKGWATRNYSSCADWMSNHGKYELSNGYYLIYDSNLGWINVYCDFDYSNNYGWTLIQSASRTYLTSSDFIGKSFVDDVSYNMDYVSSYIESKYRLSRAWMLSLKDNSRLGNNLLYSTCNFDTSFSQDWLLLNMTVTDTEYDIFYGSAFIAVCVSCVNANIRGYDCSDNTVKMWQSSGAIALVIDSSQSGCGCDSWTSDAASSEDNFGYSDGTINTAFTCTASDSSSTQWWLGAEIDDFAATADNATSCADWMIYDRNLNGMTSTLTDGIYTISSVSGLYNDGLNVYCAFDYTNEFAWTLFESGSLTNMQDSTKLKQPWTVDLSQNEDSVYTYKDSLYRMSQSEMLGLKENSQYLLATCEFDTSLDSSSDYWLLKISDMEYDAFNETFNWKCITTESITVHGTTCENNGVATWSINNEHIHSDNSKTACGCDSTLNSVVIEDEDDFGSYATVNTAFSCSASSSSTTQWWLGSQVNYCEITFYSGTNYDGTSYGPWSNGTFTYASDFSDNSINSFMGISNYNNYKCIVSLYSGCCPVNGNSVTFEISDGETRYVDRNTEAESGDISLWTSSSLSVSGIVISFEEIIPTHAPTVLPSNIPTSDPSYQPTIQPSNNPTYDPSGMPSTIPSDIPSMIPSSNPTSNPSSNPSSNPTINPTVNPSSEPTSEPTNEPSQLPTMIPSDATNFPTDNPTTYVVTSLSTDGTTMMDINDDDNLNSDGNNSIDTNTIILVASVIGGFLLISLCVVAMVLRSERSKKTQTQMKQEQGLSQIELNVEKPQSNNSNAPSNARVNSTMNMHPMPMGSISHVKSLSGSMAAAVNSANGENGTRFGGDGATNEFESGHDDASQLYDGEIAVVTPEGAIGAVGGDTPGVTPQYSDNNNMHMNTTNNNNTIGESGNSHYVSWNVIETQKWIESILVNNGIDTNMIKTFLKEFCEKQINGNMLKKMKLDDTIIDQLKQEFSKENQRFGIWMAIKDGINNIDDN